MDLNSRDPDQFATRNVLGKSGSGKIDARMARRTRLDPTLPKYETFRNVLELQPAKDKANILITKKKLEASQQ